MSDDERTPNRNAAFLPIGFTFLAVGLAFLFGPSVSLSWAFIPIGIAFIAIWLSGRQPAPEKRRDKNGDGSVPPASDTDRGDSSDGAGASGGDGGGGGGD